MVGLSFEYHNPPRIIFLLENLQDYSAQVNDRWTVSTKDNKIGYMIQLLWLLLVPFPHCCIVWFSCIVHRVAIYRVVYALHQALITTEYSMLAQVMVIHHKCTFHMHGIPHINSHTFHWEGAR